MVFKTAKQSSVNKPSLGLFVLLGLVLGVQSLQAQLYDRGDIVENFTLTNRETGEPVSLYDLEGKIIFLEWFAYWCPFCQAAAADVEPGIVNYYNDRGGNPNGVEVMHVALNLERTNASRTDSFINFYNFSFVLDDTSRLAANRFANGGQPIFAIINGVANSPSHEQWELVYSRLGYGDLSQPIDEFRSFINSVAAAADPVFTDYLNEFGVPENQRDAGDDPDFDGVPNVLEYLHRSDATNTADVFRPRTTIVMIGVTRYLALEYVRNTEAGDLTDVVQFSSDPGFSTLNNSIPHTVQSIGENLERVTVRSGTIYGQQREFARLIVDIDSGEN